MPFAARRARSGTPYVGKSKSRDPAEHLTLDPPEHTVSSPLQSATTLVKVEVPVRDGHRIKEKYELSLDNRQIVSLFIAGIVVMGTIFVLGVVVGKNLAGTQRSGAAADLLSALDEKAAAMEQVRNEPRLTFQDELTRKTAPESTRPSPVESKATFDSKGMAESRFASPSQSAPQEPTPSVPPPSETLQDLKEAVAAKDRLAAESAAGTEKRSGEQAAPASPAPKPEAPSGKDRVKQAIARAEKRPAEPAGKEGGFTLQLAASQARADADRFAERLREKGYAPYVVESDVSGRGRWYRVRMGRFASKEAAVKYLDDFRRETQLEAFVASAN